MYNTIEECRKDPMLQHLSTLLQTTGVHGGFVEYEKDKGFLDSGIYFVGTIGSFSELHIDSKNPADIQRKVEGDPSMFYPYEFAVKITDADPLVTFDKIAEFCHRAELFIVHFGLEKVEIPGEIPMDEVNGLRAAVMNSNNLKISGAMRDCVRKDMNKAIHNYDKRNKQGIGEKIGAKFKSQEQKIAEFIKENKQINYETIDEKQLEDFIKYLKNRDPDLEYILSDKIDVVTGLEEAEEGRYDPYGAYTEKDHSYREIYFKRADEQIFQDAFNHLKYSQRYNNGHSIGIAALAKQGPVMSAQIPKRYMKIVDSCLAKWNVPYSIDSGCISRAESTTIPILYLVKDKNIIEGMSRDLCKRFASETYVGEYDRMQYKQIKRDDAAKTQKRGWDFGR